MTARNCLIPPFSLSSAYPRLYMGGGDCNSILSCIFLDFRKFKFWGLPTAPSPEVVTTLLRFVISTDRVDIRESTVCPLLQD